MRAEGCALAVVRIASCLGRVSRGAGGRSRGGSSRRVVAVVATGDGEGERILEDLLVLVQHDLEAIDSQVA